MDELPVALWAYRTTPRQLTRETPYALAFGSKVRIPIKFGLETLHSFDTAKIAQSLDEIEEKRERAAIRMDKY